jgi:DMSO/TMAO reductase YedYZ molybdopterin-dependent catalytic subunit
LVTRGERHRIQGWTAIGRWGGVHREEILQRRRPLPEAIYLVFHSFVKHEKSGKPYYECPDIRVGPYSRAILA